MHAVVEQFNKHRKIIYLKIQDTKTPFAHYIHLSFILP